MTALDSDSIDVDPENYWVFGYGSLIYKPPPHAQLRVPGYITGHVRRFWQSSNDHRGTPEAPGRVVTLIEHDFYSSFFKKTENKHDKDEYDNNNKDSSKEQNHFSDPHETPESGHTWGVAYKIEPKHARSVKEYLDHREKNGYSEHLVSMKVHSQFRDIFNSEIPEKYDVKPLGSSIECHVYIGKPDNEAFVGFQDPENLARHIVKSRGPSGENKEYLYNLHESLLDLARLREDQLSKSGEIQSEIHRLLDNTDPYKWEDDVHISDLVAKAKAYEKLVHG